MFASAAGKETIADAAGSATDRYTVVASAGDRPLGRTIRFEGRLYLERAYRIVGSTSQSNTRRLLFPVIAGSRLRLSRVSGRWHSECSYVDAQQLPADLFQFRRAWFT